MIQRGKAQGWEGRLAPALFERRSTSGGKPPFLTYEIFYVGLFHFSLSNFSEPLCLCGG